jgi:hypothetical protein
MFMNETNALDNNMVIDDFIRVREKLEQTA